MALPVGCSRCGDTSWRQRQVPTRPGFVPVRIASEGCFATAGGPGRVASSNTMPREMVSPPGQFRGEIEIEVSGARIWVEPGVEATTLSTVLSALRGGA